MTDFPLDHILPVFNIGSNRVDQYNNNLKMLPGGGKKNVKGGRMKGSMIKGGSQPPIGKTLDAERHSLGSISPVKTTKIGHTPTPTMSKVTLGYTPIQPVPSKATIAGIPCTASLRSSEVNQPNLIKAKEYEAYSQ